MYSSFCDLLKNLSFNTSIYHDRIFSDIESLSNQDMLEKLEKVLLAVLCSFAVIGGGTVTANAEGETYKVEYQFVSGTEGYELPQDVYDLLPTDDTEYSNGARVTATDPNSKSVSVDEGVWIFDSYNVLEATIDNSNITFIGTWKFTKNNTNPVVEIDDDSDNTSSSFDVTAWRNTWSGESLGTQITKKQLAQIYAGTYDDIGLGDYWTLDGVVYRVADVDYYYNVNDNQYHDLILIPDATINTSSFDMFQAKDNNSTGYFGSKGRSILQSTIKDSLPTDIKNNLLTHNMYMSTATSTSSPYGNTFELKESNGIELISVKQAFGSNENIIQATKDENWSNYGFQSPEQDTQFALFQFSSDGQKLETSDYGTINCSNLVKGFNWWLSSTARQNSNGFAYVQNSTDLKSNSNPRPLASLNANFYNYYARPAITIKGVPRDPTTIYSHVTYRFESATEGMELPETITSLIPTNLKVLKGTNFTPTQPTTTSVKAEDRGTWTFNGYTPENVDSINEDVEFVGKWSYTFPTTKEFHVKTKDELTVAVKEINASSSTTADSYVICLDADIDMGKTRIMFNNSSNTVVTFKSHQEDRKVYTLSGQATSSNGFIYTSTKPVTINLGVKGDELSGIKINFSGASNAITLKGNSNGKAILNMYSGSSIENDGTTSPVKEAYCSVKVDYNAVFNMYGGTIKGNVGYKTGGVYVTSSTSSETYPTEFNMYGGSIENCSSNPGTSVAAGGAIYVEGNGDYLGTVVVNINGGEIKNCSNSSRSYQSSGGILVMDAVLNMTDGSITNCENKDTSCGWGGAITCLSYGTLNLNNATIQNNKSNAGGAITFYSYGSNTIQNCIITNNEAKSYAGGIYVYGRNSSMTVDASSNNLITDNNAGNYADDIYSDVGIIKLSTAYSNSTSGVNRTVTWYQDYLGTNRYPLKKVNQDVSNYITDIPLKSVSLYNVSYSFTSSSENKTLPETINSLLPSSTTVESGNSFTPSNPLQTTVEDTVGSWTFDGYTPTEVLSVDSDITFTGKWKFNKVDPTYEVPSDLKATYGQTLNDVSLPSGWSWKEESSTPVGNAGENTFVAIYTPTDTDTYNIVEVNVTITVSKADPIYTMPNDLTGTIGQKLEDIELPNGFTWKDSSQSLDTLGTNTYSAIYTPTDTDNYNTIEVIIQVSVIAKVGDTSGNIEITDNSSCEIDERSLKTLKSIADSIATKIRSGDSLENEIISGLVVSDISKIESIVKNLQYSDNVEVTLQVNIQDSTPSTEIQNAKAKDEVIVTSIDVDVDLTVTVKDMNGKVKYYETTDVKELPNAITLSMQVSTASIQNKVVRVLYSHDAQVETISNISIKENQDTTSSITFTTKKFSNYVVLAKDKTTSVTKVETKKNGYDDGSPFTRDACGNVFDRWGNEIYHVEGCTVNNYKLVPTDTH